MDGQGSGSTPTGCSGASACQVARRVKRTVAFAVRLRYREGMNPFNSRHQRNRWRVAAQERDPSCRPLDENPQLLPMPVREVVPTVAIRDDDPRLLSAVLQARSTFDEFLTAFADRLPDDFFAIKGLFTDDFGKEYLWVKPVLLGDEIITGLLDNAPRVVQTIRLGQTVRIARATIYDWLYVSQGTRHGAYTVEALQALLTQREAA
jgi:uncharacterized protein YegJ (DUF2314 family)